MVPITIGQQCAGVMREIRLREKVYPRLVNAGKMTQKSADSEIDMMRAVLLTLREAARESAAQMAMLG